MKFLKKNLFNFNVFIWGNYSMKFIDWKKLFLNKEFFFGFVNVFWIEKGFF